jgi:SAM-dependent methyltransferase
MDEALYDEIFLLESRHWWFRAKRRIVRALLRKHLPRQAGRSPRVCDIGCGCGMMLLDLRAAGYDAVGIDDSAKALDYCRRRGAEALEGRLPDGLPLAPASVDAALLLDVLEHVDDDAASLRAVVEAVRPGGVVIATVPAYRFLWTRRDEFHHHKRRYSRRMLRAVLRSHPQGRIALLSSMNSVLFPMALAERLVRRIVPEKKAATLRLPWWPVNRALEAAFAAERLPLTLGIPLPWGLSLVGVVRRESA